ncbi:Wall-associated receptor kinase 5 [Citrus sinensis]|nr:Wall-associated receptor kinase 5 [Citrus sinensis]
MPKFTLSNSFRFGSRREGITNFDSESIETILKKLNKDWLGQFAREEQIQADLIGWKKMLLKINEVLDDALEKQTKEESVKKWLGKLRNLACDVDYLLDEFQTEAFQKMLLLDDDVMSTVKEVNARLQDIASQIKQLDLRKKSGRKSRNVRGVISSAVRRGRGGRDPGPTIHSHPGLAFLRMKIFSKSEMIRATKNFDRSRCLSQGGFVSVYKGVLHDNIQVAVKTYRRADKIRITERELLRIISQVNHKNVVKILGLCLETEVPLLVYEFASNGTLLDHIRCESSQVLKTWKTCLRIAAETASALDYLHSLASPPIIHGDVKSANILLNDNYTAKVADFESSVLISSDAETAMSTILIGTSGYLDPVCINTGKLTKKSDVYSFGVVLAELLTGKKPGSCMTLASNKKISMVPYFLNSIKNNGLRQILNFHVADESEMKEIEIVAELASKCLRIRGTERPTMKQVSEELDRLRRLHENFWAQKKNKETEHLLGESSSYATAVIAQPDARTVVSIDIENYYGT